MPRLRADVDYRLNEELSLSSGSRSRSRSPHSSFVGYTSKEEQERQDHELALRLQEEADREHLAVVENTLTPEEIEAILSTPLCSSGIENEPAASSDGDSDVVFLSAGASPAISEPRHSPTPGPTQPPLTRAEQRMYDGELTLLSEGENNAEADEPDGDGDDDDDEEDDSDSDSDENHVEEQSDDSGEEMDDSEDENGAASDSGESNNAQSGSSDSDSSDDDGDDDDLSTPERLLSNVYAGMNSIELAITDLEQIFDNERREHAQVTPYHSDEEEEEPDDTVIRSGDYGRCTICFEEVPYDPVGCIYCQQLIGCRRCVNRWYKAAQRARDDVDFLGGHPPSNHKQCPLCRHEWAEQVEVTSIFLLKDD